MAELKEGDVVELKSGGPKMTVKSPKAGMSGNEVICQWFDGKELKNGSFRADSLKKVDAN